MTHDPLISRATRSKLFAIDCGSIDHPTILFIHGITGSHRYFTQLRKHLEQSFRLLIPDLLGFGHSPKPHIRYTLEIFRDSIRNFIIRKNLENTALSIVGHSLGALIAVQYAATYSEHVHKVVLVSLPIYPNEDEAHDVFWSGSASYRNLLTTNTVNDNIAQIVRSGLGMSLRYLSRIPAPVILDSRKFTFTSLTSTLENCLLKYNVNHASDALAKTPPASVLLLHGERDQVSLLENVLEIRKRFPHLPLKTIKDSGHHILLTHAAECADTIHAFLVGEEMSSVDSRKTVKHRILHTITKKLGKRT